MELFPKQYIFAGVDFWKMELEKASATQPPFLPNSCIIRSNEIR